nr:hypothetical protein [Tanacetum cinerariifolium]
MNQPPLRVCLIEHSLSLVSLRFSEGRSRSVRHFQGARRNDDAVIVGVHVFTGAESHAAKCHHHVQIAQSAFIGLERVTGQRLHTEIGLRQDIDIT